MKTITPYIILLLIAIAPIDTFATPTESDEIVGEVTLKPVFVFARGVDERRFWRLVKAVKRVYPIAKIARDKLAAMEQTLDTLDTKRQRKEHIKTVYREIKEEYVPVLLKMSYTDGRVLIRLIDRETDYTAYEVIDEFKGGVSATFWQGVGRIFGQNLKDEYGESIEDKTIERIIKYYEAGLL